ncbi:MAG: multiheme c-type cytochrome [Pirellulaceae bacterium]|nr:multiheme c-type cytochrome [Pirellulaceae bacterium]
MSSGTDKPKDLSHLLDTPKKAKPARVIGPRLRILLVIVLALFSLLGANGVYLTIITWTQHFTGEVYEDLFYQYMFLAHLVLGVILILPVVVFGFAHLWLARNRRNRRAVRIGYALFAISIVVLISGVLLTRQFGFDLKQPLARSIIYWAHIVAPLAAIWLYWLHRLVGPRIKWYVGGRIALATAAAVGIMVYFQFQDPRQWNVAGPKEGEKYFQPSLARTSTGNFIPAKALMNDEYCTRCHQDIYNNWFHSAHHFSSFNNPAYLYAVRETRKKVMERDGTVQASRWCAGCHDVVPFFSGAFDDPNYDDVNHPTSQAGITCTACHAITHVNSTRGNADYVIEEPIQYPFTFSENPLLQKVNELLVKAKPGFHKQTFLKPLHKTAEFCSTCHKVHLPKELTAYKEFLRGQNHYDSYLLSGVSGHGASSFYYPPVAQENCNGCHMPVVASNDFGAKYSNELKTLAVHDHFFPGANTALPYWRGDDEKWIDHAKKLLTDSTRIDIFGVRKGGKIDGELVAPIGPEYPVLEAGEQYLVETVVRTLKLGHLLTQGTVDSNELWVELTAKSGDQVIGISGGMAEAGEVDPWSHFINVFMLDKNGNRIARRNAQDIFVPLYNHQIPPGAGQTIHYALQLPQDLEKPVEVTAKLKYRKFDKGYIDFMNEAYKEGDISFTNRGEPGKTKNDLPITVMAQDTVVFEVRKKNGELITVDREKIAKRETPIVWQRWNDYGIGMLLMGNSQLRQAAAAFSEVEKLGRFDGPLNLARVMFAEGDLNGATAALGRAATMDPKPPAWTMAWLSGEVSRQQGFLEEAANSFRSVLNDKTQEMRDRKFDFSLDFRVRNSLGLTLLDLAEVAESRGQTDRMQELIEEARGEFEQTLLVDSEDVTAHANLAAIYQRLGNPEKAEFHGKAHVRYKPDDNAADVARPIARRQYPAADHAAESLVIYWMHRPGAHQLPAEFAIEPPAKTGAPDSKKPNADDPRDDFGVPLDKVTSQDGSTEAATVGLSKVTVNE